MKGHRKYKRWLKKQRKKTKEADKAEAQFSVPPRVEHNAPFQKPTSVTAYAPFGHNYHTSVGPSGVPGGRIISGEILFGPQYAPDPALILSLRTGPAIQPAHSRRLRQLYAKDWRCSMTFLTLTIKETDGRQTTLEGVAYCGANDEMSQELGVEAALRRALEASTVALPSFGFCALTKRERKDIWAAFLPSRVRWIITSSIKEERHAQKISKKKQRRRDTAEAMAIHAKERRELKRRIIDPQRVVKTGLPDMVHKRRYHNVKAAGRRIVLA